MRENRLRVLASLALILGLLSLPATAAFAQTAIDTDDLDQISWRHIGPWTFSGRISAICVPDGQNKVWYIGAASGGVWKSVDQGVSFTPIFEDYGNMSIGYIAVAPSDHNIIYVATGEAMHARSSSHGNGVFKSTDAGETWTHLPDLRNSHYINKVTVHPTNPDVVYVAAEGKLYSNEMDCERGMYKSTDGGESFARVWPLDDRGVGDFVMDPTNPDVIIAMAYKTYRRAWTFIDRQEGNWLYKTSDGGRTWKRLENGLPLEGAFGRGGLAMYPKDPSIVYARIDEVVNLGIATNPRGSNLNTRRPFASGFSFEDWADFEINRDMARLARHRKVEADDINALAQALNELIENEEFLSDARVDMPRFVARAREVFADDEAMITYCDEIEEVWAMDAEEGGPGRIQALNRFVLSSLYAGAIPPQQPQEREGVIYKSTDQGESWTLMTDYTQQRMSSLNQTEAGYYGRLEVDPNDPDILYACNTSVVKSVDGGVTFQGLNWYRGMNKLHVDTRVLWVDPLDSDHILNGNDGGLGETWNGGDNWLQKDTISAQQFYDISVDAEFPYNVMGGTQDNGAWFGPSRNRNSSGVFQGDWTYLPTGDAYYVVHDWWNPEWIYFESQFGSSSRMNMETGQRWGLAPRAERGEPAERYQWDAPIFLSPHNPGIVFVTSQHVWRSMTRGEPGSFVRVSPDLSRNDPERQAESRMTNLQYATVYTFAESAVQAGVYWAGTDDGNLQLSTDFGTSWTNITWRFWNEDGTPKSGISGDRIPFDRWVVRVTPSQHVLERCYVAFSGYRTHDEDTTYLFVTEDFGQTWRDLSGGMMNNVNDIVEDPDNPDMLYLATDYGLFVSWDRGQNWVNMSESAPDVIMYDLDIQTRERDLAIGTYGRGIYIADVWPFKEFSTETFAKEVHLFEPQRVIDWAWITQGGPSYGEFAYASNPSTEAKIYYYLKNEVESASLDIYTLEGEQLASARIQGATSAGLHLGTWNLRITPQPGAGGARQFAGGGRGFGSRSAEPGTYKVVLMVNGEEAASHYLRIVLDPVLNPDKP